MQTFIKVAHSYSRKHGYRARAYATQGQGKFSLTVGLGDTREEAEGDAVRYVQDLFRRDGLPVPDRIENVGKLPGALCDAYAF